MNSVVYPSIVGIHKFPKKLDEILRMPVTRYRVMKTRCTIIAVLFTYNLLAHSIFITRYNFLSAQKRTPMVIKLIQYTDASKYRGQ